MRRNYSIATLLLAIGAGYVAARMWNQNAYGIQDKVRAGSRRVRLRGGEMMDEGRHMVDDAWQRGRRMAEDLSERSRQMMDRGRMPRGDSGSRGYADYDYPERSFGQRHPMDRGEDYRGYYGDH